MTKMSFLDKINVLLELSKTSNSFIIVIIFLAFLAYILFTTNKKNAKRGKRIYLIVYTFIFIYIIISYSSSLADMFDYMMNNFFIAIYFPSLAIYFAAIIATNIILWVSVFNFRTSKIVKNINIVIYCIINYLLTLILNIITNNNLDVFTQSSIYSNKEATALIELSSTVFILWIIFLIIYKIIRNYLNKNKVPVQKKINKPIKRRLPQNIIETKAPNYIQALPTKQTNINKKITPSINHDFDNLLTIEDYRLLLTILKEHKEKERLEQERKQRVEAEQTKYRELQELYGIVR